MGGEAVGTLAYGECARAGSRPTAHTVFAAGQRGLPPAGALAHGHSGREVGVWKWEFGGKLRPLWFHQTRVRGVVSPPKTAPGVPPASPGSGTTRVRFPLPPSTSR